MFNSLLIFNDITMNIKSILKLYREGQISTEEAWYGLRVIAWREKVKGTIIGVVAGGLALILKTVLFQS
jgi:hypothetical protein